MVEKYEVIGKEADVAEWWKIADKAAQECHCQFTEGYDCGDGYFIFLSGQILV